MEPELEAFLKDNKEFQLNDHGKVHCNVTNHDIVAKMSEVKKHMESDKYLHAKNWYNYDYSKYLPYIQEHRTDPKKLFCIVTMTSINKIPEVVERTVNSKKFKRLCEQYDKRQQERKEREKKGEQKKEKEEEEENDIDEMLALVDEDDGKEVEEEEEEEEVDSQDESQDESQDNSQDDLDEENQQEEDSSEDWNEDSQEDQEDDEALLESDSEEEEVPPPKKTAKRQNAKKNPPAKKNRSSSPVQTDTACAREKRFLDTGLF